MINLIQALFRAWQAGQIIRDPAKWKSGAEIASAVTVFISAIFTIVIVIYPKSQVYLTVETAAAAGTLLLAILGLIQAVIGRVSTKKEVGLHVLFEDDTDGPNHGRRDEDIKLTAEERKSLNDKIDIARAAKVASDYTKLKDKVL